MELSVRKSVISHSSRWYRACSVWRQPWKLSCPSKIKNFAWKALHGCLPCFVILANKHIPIDGVNCPRCLTEAEDIKHVPFTCSRAKDVWLALGVWEEIERMLMVDRSGSIVIEETIRTGGLSMEFNNMAWSELVITCCWYIWWQRW